MSQATGSLDGRAPGPPAPVADVAIELRPLRTQREYLACIALQRETWGETFGEAVPPSLLQVCQRIGGVTAGAFDEAGRLLGFVFGVSGVEGGRLVHWSDMLAVARSAQGLGIGRRLKEFQRDYLRALGVEVVYWSYDPLVARNANLNLSRLGAEVVEYVPDMYGDSDSVLHRGLGTDRFIVAWRIAAAEPEGERAPAAAGFEQAPILSEVADGGGIPTSIGPVFRVEVPADIQEVKARSPEEAAGWRRATRGLFLGALEQGYRVRGFHRDEATDRCFYVLRSINSETEGS